MGTGQVENVSRAGMAATSERTRVFFRSGASGGGRIDIIEVAIAECLTDQPIIALKKHHRGLLFGAVLHQGFSRRNFSIWSSNLRICLKTSLTRARARRYRSYCSLLDRNRSNFSGGIVIR